MPNNPAERLLLIYQKGRSDNRGSQIAKKVWAEILDVPEFDTPLLLKRLGQVAGLCQDISERVKQLKGLNPEDLITWIPTALQPFQAYNLGSQFSQFLEPINENVLSLLRICSGALSAQIPEPNVDVNQLKQLRASIAEFVTELSIMSVPADAKAFLMKHAQIIDDAIIDYQLQGFGALDAGLERAIGHAFLYRNEIRSWKAESPQPFTKVMAIIAIYLGVLNAASRTSDLVKQLFGPSSQSSTVLIGDKSRTDSVEIP